MAPPVMTPEQRAAGLAAAQRIRSARSQVRKNLEDGTLTLPDVLGDGGDITAGMRVSAVLVSLPRVGKASAEKAMQRLGIMGNRRVGALSARQREALQEMFGRVVA